MYIRKKQLVVENDELKWKLLPIRFNGDAIRQLMDEAEKQGYVTEPVAEGVCGFGTFLMWGPTEQHRNFLIREVYENEWTSRYTVEQFTKMPKKLMRDVEKMKVRIV